MANYKKILKKTTAGDKEYPEIGITVPGNGQVTLEPGSYYIAAEEIDISGDLAADIRNGTIIVNDGVRDITVGNDLDLERAVDYLKWPDRAFNVRFETESERSNGFPADVRNVQNAIEYVRSSAIGSLFTKQFAVTGNTANKWLNSNSNSPSDTTPLVVPQSGIIKGITFINADNNVDIDVEIYVNTVLQHTWEVRNKRVAWNVGALNIAVAQGDRLGIYMKKYVGGTGDTTAQDPIIEVFVKITSEVAANSGIQNGLT